MPTLDSICNAIRSHLHTRIWYVDHSGQAELFQIEPYTLGLSRADQLILTSYVWASYTGHVRRCPYVFSFGRIFAVEPLEYGFQRPHDYSTAQDWSLFKAIICDWTGAGLAGFRLTLGRSSRTMYAHPRTANRP